MANRRQVLSFLCVMQVEEISRLRRAIADLEDQVKDRNAYRAWLGGWDTDDSRHLYVHSAGHSMSYEAVPNRLAATLAFAQFYRKIPAASPSPPETPADDR